MTVSKRNKTALYPPGTIAGYALQQDVFMTSDSVYNYTLSEIPFEDFEIVSFSGRVMARGASYDYTVSGTAVSFLDKTGSARTFKANDVVLVDYRY